MSGEDFCILDYYESPLENIANADSADYNITNMPSGSWYNNTGYNCPPQASYTIYNLIGNLQRGDILVEEDTTVNGWIGHAGIVEGIFYHASSNRYYVRIVEAISAGVTRGIIDNRIQEKSGRLYRINTNGEEIEDAATSFAVSQLNKAWHLHASRNPDPSHGGWYCSELVWASYYKNFFDIAPNLNPLSMIKPHDIDSLSTLISISI